MTTVNQAATRTIACQRTPQTPPPFLPGMKRSDLGFSDMGQMARRYRPYVFGLAVVMVIMVGAFGAVYGHDVPHGSPSGASKRIDPRVTYPAGLVAAGGGHFHAILLGPATRWMLAGTHLGLFRSRDRGLSWQLVAARFSGEDVHALVRDPATGRISAATHGQGLVMSLDDGRTWKDDSRGLPTHDLHALTLDPRRPSRVYVWAVDHGLLTRDTPTERWQRLAQASSLGDVRALAVHPRDQGRLYAATATGIWLSSDGGRHWERPPDGLKKPAAGLAVIPGAPDVVMAATEEGIFAGDTMARQWRSAGGAPEWWGPLVALASEPAGHHLIALSHEGVVACRRIDGGDWTPLSKTQSGRRAARQE
jgi:photosystem II stability/assembly factor-like uncharacterized protein